MLKRAFALALVLLLSPALGSAAGSSKTEKALQAALKVYSSAVRWNDFELAAESIDPALRVGRGFTEADEAHYKRYQVSGYTLKSSDRPDPANYTQRVELRIIDVDSQTERTKTDRQHWRWDAAGKRWWLVSGLPRLD